MIESFVSSWSLFHNAYLSGWLIGLLLSLVGVLVVARDQIFIGAAVSQASMLGIAVGILLGSWITLDEQSWWRSDIFHAIMGGIFAVLAALITVPGGKTAGRESHEAVTGWVFLLSGSLSILMLAHSPHGLAEIQRLLSSTIIGATETDIWVFTTMTLVTGVTLAFCYRRILLLMMDPEMASAVGMKVVLWESLLSVWLGASIGFSIHVSGVLYTFGCLVLPALVAKNLGRDVRTLFFIAPAVALGSGVIAFVLANYYDYPPGQMAATCLCLLLAMTWVFRFLRAS